MSETMRRLVVFGAMIVAGVLAINMIGSMIENEKILDRLFALNQYDKAIIYGVTIQNMMWVMFFVTLGELGIRVFETNQSDNGFAKGYLPEDNHSILEKRDMGKISKNVTQDSNLKGGLAYFIKRLVMQFQTSNSIEQTQNMLNSQLEMQGASIDSNYNMIRYLTWLIPTLGFIGTVIGIADALALAGEPGKATEPTFVAELTKELAVAFDTTFVALVMSAVLVFFMHVIQGKEESNLVKIGQYCLDNFINRLYIKKEK